MSQEASSVPDPRYADGRDPDLPSEAAERLHEALEAARAAHRSLREVARAYENHRRQLFRAALERSGQAWCSWRQHPVPQGDTRLVAISDQHLAIHRICKDCLIAALQGDTKPFEVRREGEGYVSLATGERLQGRRWGNGSSLDFSDPSGVPHAAVEAFGLPLKIMVIRTDDGYGIHAGGEDSSDRYCPY